MNRPVRRALTAAAAGLALLAGCTDNPEPAPLEPAASSPSASESPDAAPEMPDEARENTPEGAEAFVRHWVEVLNHATTTGEVAAFRPLATEACTACDAITDFVRTTYRDGGRIETTGWVLQEMSVALAPDSSAASAAVVVEVAPERIYASSDGEAEVRRGGRQPMDLGLAWSKNEWIVERLELIQ